MRLHLAILTLIIFLAGACGGNDNSELRQDIEKLRNDFRMLKQVKYDLESLESEVEALKKRLSPSQSHGDDSDTPITEVTLKANGNYRDDPFIGEETAPIVIMIFIDYQSSSCRKVAEELLPKLRDEFVDQHKARVIVRDFPLPNHPQALSAATFAHCAGEQGQYWKAHDLLFANPALVDSGDFPGLTGRLSDVNKEKLAECIKSKRYEAEAHKDTDDARLMGSQGVPGFFIGRNTPNGDLSGVFVRGAQPFGVLRAEIVKQLEPGKSKHSSQNSHT